MKVLITALFSLLFFFKSSQSLIPIVDQITFGTREFYPGMDLTQEQGYIFLLAPDPVANSLYEVVTFSISEFFGRLTINFVTEYIFLYVFIIFYKNQKKTNGSIRTLKPIIIGLLVSVISTIIICKGLGLLREFLIQSKFYSIPIYYLKEFVTHASEGSLLISFYNVEYIKNGVFNKYFIQLIPHWTYLALSTLVSFYSIFLLWFSILTTNNKTMYKVIAKSCEILDKINPKVAFSFSLTVFAISTGLMQGYSFSGLH